MQRDLAHLAKTATYEKIMTLDEYLTLKNQAEGRTPRQVEIKNSGGE